MRFDLLKDEDWERFNSAFPLAKAFLQELALRRELEMLQKQEVAGILNDWSEARLYELRQWAAAVEKTRSASNG